MPKPFRSQAASALQGDINGDGKVDIFDLSILLSNFGKSVATPTPTPSPSPTSTQTPTPSGTILFRGDFETGDLSQWAANQSCPGGVTIVSSPVRRGTKAAKYTVADGDTHTKCASVPTESPRAQLVSKPLFRDGDDDYIGFSYFFPANFPTITSWLQVSEIYGSPYGGSPTIGIDVKGNRIVLARSAQNNYDEPWSMSRDIAKGVNWEDLVLHVKFSTDPNVGFVEIWHNGTKQKFTNGQDKLYYATLATGINYAAGGTNQVYANLYRSATSPLGTTTLYEDEIMVGTTYASVAR